MQRQLFVIVGVFLFFLSLTAGAAPISLEQAGRAGKTVAALRHDSDKSSNADSPDIPKPGKQIRSLMPLQKNNFTLGYVVHLEHRGIS